MSDQDTTPPATGAHDSSPAPEQHEFSAEVGRLLDLVVHALYSDREIFLRELVANAADATDRRRFEALTDAARALPEGAKIRIDPDKPARQLTISDDGAGMTRDEMVKNLGTIARSGTRAFGQAINAGGASNADKPDDRPSLIGQFGVGFYAAFHGGGPGRGHVAPRRRGRCMVLVVRGPRQLHHRAGHPRDARHRHRAAHQVRRRRIPRALPA